MQQSVNYTAKRQTAHMNFGTGTRRGPHRAALGHCGPGRLSNELGRCSGKPEPQTITESELPGPGSALQAHPA